MDSISSGFRRLPAFIELYYWVDTDCADGTHDVGTINMRSYSFLTSCMAVSGMPAPVLGRTRESLVHKVLLHSLDTTPAIHV